MKMKFALLCVAIILAGFVHQVMAQSLPITGKVLNKTTGELLVGASVSIEGTTKSVLTDANGIFKITANKGATLIVSYVGLTTAKQTVTDANQLTFSLVESAANNLNDVVVVGYGTQKVTKVSGAIATVKAADIEKLKAVRIEEALQGASGVNVVLSGSPGAAPNIIIRGIPSYSGNGPLIVVDGLQQTQSDLNAISPNDIESMTVLKDAATAAIYGVSGGNGVLVITTKSGRKNQKSEINLNSTYGVQQIANYIPVLNASEYGAIINEGSVASGGNIIFNDLSKLGVGTNWQNEIFKDASIQTHNISAKGGSEKMTYFLSGSYLSQGGIVGGIDKSRFSRANVTANLSFDLTPKLKFIVNSTYVNQSSIGIQENSFNSVIGSAINYDPTVSVYNNVPNTVGKYGFSNLIFTEIFNPLTKLENTYNQNIGNKFYGKFEFQYQVVKNLKLTTRFAYSKYDGNAKTFNPLVFWGINNVDNSMNADGSTVAGRHNSVAHDKANYNSFNYELFGNYNFKVKGGHNFETVLGMMVAKNSGNVAGASKQDVPFNSWDFADFTAATGTNSATNLFASTGYYYQFFKRNLSYFGRVNYDYQDKYLASFTLRRDGSTAFGKNNKFGTFMSGSLGWIISKEDFFKSNTINFLKLRGSLGTVGNDNTSPQYYRIQTDYLASLYGSGNSIGYTFGNNFQSGSSLGSLANDELAWEFQTQKNIGFDMTLLKNKFTIAADYYEKVTTGLLFTPSASLYLGALGAPSANIGSTKSNGIDISLGYSEAIGKNLKFSTTLTFTTVSNVVTVTNDDGTAKIFGGYYFNGQTQPTTLYAKGYAPSVFYGFKTDGLFQTQSDIAKSARQDGAQPGDIKFVDVNGDGVINDDDKTEIGNPFAKYLLNWGLNFTYKSFDLSVLTYASVGNKIYRAYERNNNFTNKYQDVLSRWTGPNSTNDARNPRYSFTDANNNSRVSDRYIEDGSFVKIRNILLGYTLNNKTINKAFRSIRVFAQVRNAFTFTKYTGFDPEVAAGGLLDVGVDRGAYPLARTFLVGLDIKF
jgi:TonB-dependent starch-binding outer membrane protein SusC